MLSKHWDLIARTIFPVIDQPSFAPPPVCASVTGCGSTFGIGDAQEELFFAPKAKPDRFIWGTGPTFQFPTGAPQDILETGNGEPESMQWHWLGARFHVRFSALVLLRPRYFSAKLRRR